MYFYTIKGRKLRVKKPNKYLIDWAAPSRSKFQKRIKNIAYKYWYSHIVYEEFPIVGTRMTLDFYNGSMKVAVEVQGRQHNNYVEFFHGKSRLNFQKQLDRDNQKFLYCEKNNIQLIEIYDEDDIDNFREFLAGNYEYE